MNKKFVRLVSFLFAVAITLLMPHRPTWGAAPTKKPPLPYVTWAFETRHDRNGDPRSDVFLRINGRRVLLVRGAQDEFTVIHRQDYASHAVPREALTACAGWWAGQGEDLYVVRRGGRLTIFLRPLDEQAPTPAPSRLKSFPLR